MDYLKFLSEDVARVDPGNNVGNVVSANRILTLSGVAGHPVRWGRCDFPGFQVKRVFDEPL
jgi:hypothetical protein